jgi:hypothetical protein
MSNVFAMRLRVVHLTWAWVDLALQRRLLLYPQVLQASTVSVRRLGKSCLSSHSAKYKLKMSTSRPGGKYRTGRCSGRWATFSSGSSRDKLTNCSIASFGRNAIRFRARCLNLVRLGTETHPTVCHAPSWCKTTCKHNHVGKRFEVRWNKISNRTLSCTVRNDMPI